MDCFAALATTESFHRHCEERSDEAIHSFLRHGLLRCARNDGTRALLRHCLRQTRSVCARERSDEAIHSFLWHGLLRCARNDGEVYTVIARSEATKQSSLSLRGEMDCFAALAMTERV